MSAARLDGHVSLFFINKFRGFKPAIAEGKKYIFFLLPPASCPLPFFGEMHSF